MAFKIGDHFLVPEHIIMPPEKATELLEKLGITKKDMPKIPKNDTALKDLKPVKGDIIKIIRDSPTAGKSVYYRVVI
ncbi:MAG: DNA-directed RNA polymerase subunit H [Candidatus Diapherotrites archaeon]